MVDLNLKLNSFNIRYKEYGKRQAPKHLLFLHGLGSSSDRWVDIPEALSRYYHSIAVDLIGFGGSDMPKLNYTINRFREFVLDFMHAIKIDDGKTTIIGHSLGGYIAAELAIENRNMMENLAAKWPIWSKLLILIRPCGCLWTECLKSSIMYHSMCHYKQLIIVFKCN